LALSLLASRDISNFWVTRQSVQAPPLDLSRRYQAQLAPRGMPLVPGNSGLEISAGRRRETKPQGPSRAADRVTVYNNQQV